MTTDDGVGVGGSLIGIGIGWDSEWMEELRINGRWSVVGCGRTK